MRGLALLPLALALVALAACDHTSRISDPQPTPAPTAEAPTNTGGPCGDGTVLRPNEACP